MKMDLKKFIITHIKEAGDIARKNFRSSQKHFWKKDKSILTETDLKIDKYLASEIKKYFPHHNIISEEAAPIHNGGEYTWFIDPIDGTINFAQGIPYFCVSIGLAKGKEMIFGAVYDPVHNELFFAEKGKGAYLNGKKIRLRIKEKIANIIISLDIWKNAKYNLMKFQEEICKNFRVPTKRQCFCLSGCYAAIGRMDVAVFAHNSPWDVAAVSLICKEAGLKVTELDGKKFVPREEMKGIIIAKPKLHKEIMKYIKKYSNIR
jgi:myo-inositol-1(or 4)-monophosphatase